LGDKAEALRKKIVATTEGGAITGEERLREKTTQLYGNLVNYEGRPADYQVSRVASLKHELEDVAAEFQAFTAKDLREVNDALTKKKLELIRSLTREEWEKANTEP
jgi:hypothetical protein